MDIECLQNFTGHAPSHTYHNTIIELDHTFPNFGSYLPHTTSTFGGIDNSDDAPFHAANFAANTSMDSTDGGKTWKIDSVVIEPYHCPLATEETSSPKAHPSPDSSPVGL